MVLSIRVIANFTTLGSVGVLRHSRNGFFQFERLLETIFGEKTVNGAIPKKNTVGRVNWTVLYGSVKQPIRHIAVQVNLHFRALSHNHVSTGIDEQLGSRYSPIQSTQTSTDSIKSSGNL